MKTQKDNFETGINIAICEFDEDLFCHYCCDKKGEMRDWIQLIIARIDTPDTKHYVQEGDLVFYNTRTKESHIAEGHTIVCMAEDVVFLENRHHVLEDLGYAN